MNPELRFLNPEVLQKQLKEAQQTVVQLTAKINDVPTDKIIKYVLIGAVIGVGGYWLYNQNEKQKKLGS